MAGGSLVRPSSCIVQPLGNIRNWAAVSRGSLFDRSKDVKLKFIAVFSVRVFEFFVFCKRCANRIVAAHEQPRERHSLSEDSAVTVQIAPACLK